MPYTPVHSQPIIAHDKWCTHDTWSLTHLYITTRGANIQSMSSRCAAATPAPTRSWLLSSRLDDATRMVVCCTEWLLSANQWLHMLCCIVLSKMYKPRAMTGTVVGDVSVLSSVLPSLLRCLQYSCQYCWRSRSVSGTQGTNTSRSPCGW